MISEKGLCRSTQEQRLFHQFDGDKDEPLVDREE